jgi:hypothetical protein
MYLLLSEISSETQIYNFGYLSSGHYIYVSKDLRIRGYFSKPKGAREQKKKRETNWLNGYGGLF